MGNVITNLQRLTSLLADTEQVLLDIATQTQQIPLPKDLAAGVEQTAYVHELMQRALAWQSETERLRQLLSDHPMVALLPDPLAQTTVTTTETLDNHYARIMLSDVWIHQSPVAFQHRGSVYQMPRPSFREVYRMILRDLSSVFVDTFVTRCKVLQHTHHLPITNRENVYNFAVFRYESYFFNIQLPADKIRQYIAGLYDAFALPQREFVVWVKK